MASSEPLHPGHRRGFIFRGSQAQTRAAVEAYLAPLRTEEIAWSEDGLADRLGQTLTAVVLDLHPGLRADVLGQAQGLVRGGGLLILRMPPPGTLPTTERQRMAIEPYVLDEVGSRLWKRLERGIEEAGWTTPSGTARLLDYTPAASSEQIQTIELLMESWRGPPEIQVLLAPRGRGKSTAIGRALSQASPPLRVALTGPSKAACRQLLEASDFNEGLQWSSPTDLIGRPQAIDLLVIDEAAQLSIPLLRKLVETYSHAHLALATTQEGYEGTGRGFVLRFLAWARQQARPLRVRSLHAPIRWSSDCPVEDRIFDILAMDALPARVESIAQPLEAMRLSREALAQDERRLRQLWGLLSHAHYRSQPSDLQRLLDAPNMSIYALLHGDDIVAANLLAREGSLSVEDSEALARGQRRIRAHALADTLISHLGETELGTCSMIRSVRIAAHPEIRRQGLASRLTEYVHSLLQPELFGTIFGATPELLRFRRSLGYKLVRLGSARGARSGEPAAVMIRPLSAQSLARVDALQGRLARDLDLHLHWIAVDSGLPLDERLTTEIRDQLPEPSGWCEQEIQRVLRSYLTGPATFESASGPLNYAVERVGDRLSMLHPAEAELVQARVLDRCSWHECAERAGQPSVKASQRALRRHLRALLAPVSSKPTG